VMENVKIIHRRREGYIGTNPSVGHEILREFGIGLVRNNMSVLLLLSSEKFAVSVRIDLSRCCTMVAPSKSPTYDVVYRTKYSALSESKGFAFVFLKKIALSSICVEEEPLPANGC
jgi:hypothetical protein